MTVFFLSSPPELFCFGGGGGGGVLTDYTTRIQIRCILIEAVLFSSIRVGRLGGGGGNKGKKQKNMSLYV